MIITEIFHNSIIMVSGYRNGYILRKNVQKKNIARKTKGFCENRHMTGEWRGLALKISFFLKIENMKYVSFRKDKRGNMNNAQGGKKDRRIISGLLCV